MYNVLRMENISYKQSKIYSDNEATQFLSFLTVTKWDELLGNL